MKKLILLLILTVAAIGSHAEIITGRAIWIIDGDTFILLKDDQASTIRLSGIDTPEKDQPGGRDATMTLVRMIGRKQVKVEITGKRDNHQKRILGRVYQGKTDINLAMVRAGLAWWYREYAPKATDLQQAEEQARQAKAGIWIMDNNIYPAEWRKRKRKAASKPVAESEISEE